MKDCLMCNKETYDFNDNCPFKCSIVEGCRICDFFGKICYECEEGYTLSNSKCIKLDCNKSCLTCD